MQYGLGIERQAARLFSGRIATLIPVAVLDEKNKPVRSVRASYANFVWGVPRETEPLFAELGVSTRPAEKGMEVINVEKKSAAAGAGVAVGDVLLAMDGAAIADRETLNRLVAQKKWGDACRLAVRRGGNPLHLTVYFRRQQAGEEADADSSKQKKTP